MLPELNPEKETKNIVNFIKASLKKSGFKRLVIGVSGGVDSATALTLAVGAIGVNKVYPLLLPCGKLSQMATSDALKFVQQLTIPKSHCEVVDIEPLVSSFCKSLNISDTHPNDQFRLGNIMARCRMIILFDRAKKHQALVLGTENKSEQMLGYFTRFGDEASDIEPIQHLYKTQVYQLAKYLAVPDEVLKKSPTAGLWHNQTDEGEFGFTYKDADEILYGLFDLNLTVTSLTEKGLAKARIQAVKSRVEQNHFKHVLPYSVEK